VVQDAVDYCTILKSNLKEKGLSSPFRDIEDLIPSFDVLHFHLNSLMKRIKSETRIRNDLKETEIEQENSCHDEKKENDQETCNRIESNSSPGIQQDIENKQDVHCELIDCSGKASSKICKELTSGTSSNLVQQSGNINTTTDGKTYNTKETDGEKLDDDNESVDSSRKKIVLKSESRRSLEKITDKANIIVQKKFALSLHKRGLLTTLCEQKSSFNLTRFLSQTSTSQKNLACSIFEANFFEFHTQDISRYDDVAYTANYMYFVPRYFVSIKLLKKCSLHPTSLCLLQNSSIGIDFEDFFKDFNASHSNSFQMWKNLLSNHLRYNVQSTKTDDKRRRRHRSYIERNINLSNTERRRRRHRSYIERNAVK